MNEQFKIFIKHFISGLVISNIPFVIIGMFMGFRVVFLAALISSFTVYYKPTITPSKYHQLIGLGLLSSIVSGIIISFITFGIKESAITTGMYVTFKFGAISMILWSLCLPLIHKYQFRFIIAKA